MKHKYIRICLFGLLIITPMLLGVAGIAKQDPLRFKRAFKRDKTAINLDKNNIHASVKNIENYLIDNFSGRLSLIESNARLHAAMGVSINPERVLVGKEGWLFLGNYYERIIDQHLGKAIIGKKKLKEWNTKFIKAQTHLERMGKEFLVVAIPNKHSIYPEFLPDGIKKSDLTSFDKIMGLKNINILNVAPLFRNIKDKIKHQLYYKTDSHWSEYGAYQTYIKICEKLDVAQKDILQLTAVDFKPEPRTRGHDLSNLSGLNVADYKQLSSTKIEILRKGLKVNKWDNPNKWQNLGVRFTVTNNSKVTIQNPNAPVKKKVLVIGDSFKKRLFDYLNSTFSTVSYIHWNKKEAGKFYPLVEKLDTDIVIYQMVERSITSRYHLRFVK